MGKPVSERAPIMVNTLLPYTHQAGVPQVSELVKYTSTNEEITRKRVL